jgi:hypothetical protein
MSLASFTKHLRIRMGKEKGNPSNKSANEHKNSLSLKSLSGWIDFGTWIGFDFWNCVLEWMLLLLYWMRISENLDDFEWGGGGIYSPQPLPSRWLFLLTMGTTDSPVVHRTLYCSLSGARHVSYPLGFGAVDCWRLLSSSGIRQSGGTPDMSGDLWLCCSDFCVALFITVHFCIRPLARREPLLRWLTEQSGAHWTVQWIIAEGANKIPESGLFVARRPGAPDSVRCATWQHTLLYCSKFDCAPTEFLSWFMLNLMHLR